MNEHEATELSLSHVWFTLRLFILGTSCVGNKVGLRNVQNMEMKINVPNSTCRSRTSVIQSGTEPL
jgi:hypothetical protein